MNKQELIEAAERLILHGETLGGCGSPYYNSEHKWQFDEIDVGEAFLEQCKRIEELENAIRNHRDQKADDRCWLDDQELYKVLNDGYLGDNTVGDKKAMLKNCERYLENRCSYGNWRTYAELEAENNRLREENERLHDSQPRDGGLDETLQENNQG